MALQDLTLMSCLSPGEGVNDDNGYHSVTVKGEL
jgi:hypothetical protein